MGLPVAYSQFPQTRFQGSKRRLLEWLHTIFEKISYDSALDAFSGSGIVAYYFKTQHKKVIANDILQSSFITAKALIENSHTTVSQQLLEKMLVLPSYSDHDHVIERNYSNVYFTNKENIWLDGFVSNLQLIEDEYLQAILYWSLFQATMIKRPYNLFHRKNLYMRENEVNRSFGNKVTWDKPFPFYIRKFVQQANHSVFDNKMQHQALNSDIRDLLDLNMDLVYLDPPYMKLKPSKSGNDYQNYYHFLEGLLNYSTWEKQINHKLKHKPFIQQKSVWIDPSQILKEFEMIIRQFQTSNIVISYNNDGFPTPETLVSLLSSYKKLIKVYNYPIKYALNKKPRTEVTITAQD